MLKPIATDIWSHESDVRLPLGLSMPARATIMRLGDGGLVVHSPLPLDDATAKELDAIGEVRFLVAPNSLHWMFLERAKQRWTNARVLAAPVLAKKLGSLPFEHLPASGRVAGMEGIRIERIQGAPGIQEHVLLHELSRSLVVGDLLFNVHECRSFWMRLVLRAGGTWKRTAQSLVWRRLVKDRAAAARSAADLLSWDFARVVVAHGDVLEDDARERTRQALTWMTSGAPKLLGTGSIVT